MKVIDLEGKPLYVSRSLKNTDDLSEWAEDNGFKIEDASSMHVTVVYSKDPVDWDVLKKKTEEITVSGGKRKMEIFDNGAVVLQFSSKELSSRHGEFENIGASFDHGTYNPHVTVSYDKSVAKLVSEIEPFTGDLIFSGEKYESLD